MSSPERPDRAATGVRIGAPGGGTGAPAGIPGLTVPTTLDRPTDVGGTAGSGGPARPDGESTPAGPRRRRGVVLTAVGVAVALVLTAVVFYRTGSAGTPAALPTSTPSASASRDPTTAEIYNTVAPSIVSIDAVHQAASSVETSGTGIIVNADGTILTALHVVKGATSIRVTFADGTTSAAVVTAAAPTIDIATLGPATLPSVVVPAVLGGSRPLAVGDNVVVIGNQLGLTGSTTAGVVSGLDRLTQSPDGTRLSGLIQFDAAVNAGSSGGPLLDGKGATIGIVVSLANPTAAGTFIGIGFAVPIGAAVGAGGGSRAPQQ